VFNLKGENMNLTQKYFVDLMDDIIRDNLSVTLQFGWVSLYTKVERHPGIADCFCIKLPHHDSRGEQVAQGTFHRTLIENASFERGTNGAPVITIRVRAVQHNGCAPVRHEDEGRQAL
jgi:hypothetical protein